ncbi:MAG: hypothetical protein J7L73_09375 [Anaerolineales bacterium]|nr:hypothetical protein [Anaerolineales bacterium]
MNNLDKNPNGNISELVECYSGFEYAERPSAFYWNGQHIKIEKIINTHRDPQGKHFLVETSNGEVFELYYSIFSNEWHISQP